jgi:hypothetical protein
MTPFIKLKDFSLSKVFSEYSTNPLPQLSMTSLINSLLKNLSYNSIHIAKN